MPDLSHILTAIASLTFFGIALSALGSIVAFRQRGGGTLRDYFHYILPKELFTRRSCYQDAGFIVLKQLLRPLLAAPLLLLTSAKCAVLAYGWLTLAFGPRAQSAMPVALFVVLLVGAVLIQDYLRFASHRLMHRFEILWDVHKVHHSAEFLTPLTNHRVHIIEEVIQQGVTGLSVGPLLGIVAFVSATSISTNTLLGFDAYMLIDTLSFAMLRHSHIGLCFGPLERYLMSPRQHHLHHSAARHHWDKNFGFLFSCWDRSAGTICYSNPQETVRVGITTEEARDYSSVLKLHFMPYIKFYRWCLLHLKPRRTRSGEPSLDLRIEPLPKI